MILSIIESHPITLLPQLLNHKSSIITSLYIHKEHLRQLRLDDEDREELMKFVKDDIELVNNEEYVIINKESSDDDFVLIY